MSLPHDKVKSLSQALQNDRTHMKNISQQWSELKTAWIEWNQRNDFSLQQWILEGAYFDNTDLETIMRAEHEKHYHRCQKSPKTFEQLGRVGKRYNLTPWMLYFYFGQELVGSRRALEMLGQISKLSPPVLIQDLLEELRKARLERENTSRRGLSRNTTVFATNDVSKVLNVLKKGRTSPQAELKSRINTYPKMPSASTSPDSSLQILPAQSVNLRVTMDSITTLKHNHTEHQPLLDSPSIEIGRGEPHSRDFDQSFSSSLYKLQDNVDIVCSEAGGSFDGNSDDEDSLEDFTPLMQVDESDAEPSFAFDLGDDRSFTRRPPENIKPEMSEQTLPPINSQQQSSTGLATEVSVTRRVNLNTSSMTETQNFHLERKGFRITNKELLKLQDGEWLNDELINFLFCHLLEHYTGSDRILVLPSQFFKELEVKGVKSMRRWLSKPMAGILSYHFTVIPIYQESERHWSLAIICNLENGFLIITIDSLDLCGSATNRKISEMLSGYVMDQATQHDSEPPAKRVSWHHATTAPQQSNGDDCGIFCIYFLKQFLESPDSLAQKVKGDELSWPPPSISFERASLRASLLQMHNHIHAQAIPGVQSGTVSRTLAPSAESVHNETGLQAPQELTRSAGPEQENEEIILTGANIECPASYKDNSSNKLNLTKIELTTPLEMLPDNLHGDGPPLKLRDVSLLKCQLPEAPQLDSAHPPDSATTVAMFLDCKAQSNADKTQPEPEKLQGDRKNCLMSPSPPEEPNCTQTFLEESCESAYLRDLATFKEAVISMVGSFAEKHKAKINLKRKQIFTELTNLEMDSQRDSVRFTEMEEAYDTMQNKVTSLEAILSKKRLMQRQFTDMVEQFGQNEATEATKALSEATQAIKQLEEDVLMARTARDEKQLEMANMSSLLDKNCTSNKRQKLEMQKVTMERIAESAEREIASFQW